MTSKYEVSEIIRMAEDLMALKKKYERKIEILQSTLCQSQTFMDQTRKEMNFLASEKVRHKKLIDDIIIILEDVRCKFKEDLDRLREIYIDIPHFMGLKAMGF